MILTSEDAQTILKTLLEIGVFASAIFAAIMGSILSMVSSSPLKSSLNEACVPVVPFEPRSFKLPST